MKRECDKGLGAYVALLLVYIAWTISIDIGFVLLTNPPVEGLRKDVSITSMDKDGLRKHESSFKLVDIGIFMRRNALFVIGALLAMFMLYVWGVKRTKGSKAGMALLVGGVVASLMLNIATLWYYVEVYVVIHASTF